MDIAAISTPVAIVVLSFMDVPERFEVEDRGFKERVVFIVMAP